jgi:histidinol-phosphate phosphatase family protein
MSAPGVIFLDRDGTLNIDTGYITNPAKIEPLPFAAQGLAKIKSLGFQTIIVTNQSAIGRGMAKPKDVDATNVELLKKLLAIDSQAIIDHVLYCEHAPKDNCECRKPKTGMIKQLSSKISIDYQKSWVIGDKISDLRFGENLGIPKRQQILVLTGEGENQLQTLSLEERKFTVSAENLVSAYELIKSSLLSQRESKCAV